jgi:hypothetical protein
VAASVRIAGVQAATAPATSLLKATSAASNSSGAVVRIAGVSAQSLTVNATVRIAGVTATTTSGGISTASVRIAGVTAVAVQTAFVWDGTRWVPVSPAGTALGYIYATSSATGTVGGTAGTAASRATATSVATGTVAIGGTLSLTGGGTLTPTGAALGATGKSGSLNLSGGGALTLVGNAAQGPAGSGSVSVFPHPDLYPPRIEIDLTGFLGSTAELTRIDQAGNRTPVRFAHPATLDGGTWTGADYEAPFGEVVTYECAATLTVTSDPVLLEVFTPWLIHPGAPDRSQPLIITAVPQRSRETNQGVHNVLGRSTPIIITDGVRRAPTFDLAVRTETAAGGVALDDLLDDAQVLLLQIRYATAARTSYEWVSVGTAQSASLTDFFGDDLINWTLSCTVTDAPSYDNQGVRTLANIAGEFATLGEIALNYATLADLLTDNLIGS